MMLWKDKKFLWLLFATLFVVILEVLSFQNIELPARIAFPIFLILIFVVGYETLWSGFKAIVSLRFQQISSLMLIAVIGAFYLGKYEEGAVIIILYTLAEKLEEIGVQKSLSSLETLVNKMPKEVQLKTGGYKKVEELEINELIIIRPGEMIPIDGVVQEGSSYVDESAITGEPIPKDKAPTDPIYAGSLNCRGYLEVKVTAKAQESTFAKIKAITYQATQSKAKTQKFIERFSKIYTPAVILLAVGTALVPPFIFHGSFNLWLLNALSLLVIACPCALVISMPVAIFSAIGNASSQGALIKGGLFLETIGKVKAIAFDKTRTLTFGTPVISDLIPLAGHTKSSLLECAAGMELFSEHPLAQSVVEAAKKENLTLHPFEQFQSVTGKGAKGNCLVCDDLHHCIGKLSFILEEHPVSQEVIEKVRQLEGEGKTAIIVATNKEIEGIIAFTDQIRPEAPSLIRTLKQLNIESVMITGDQKSAAEAVAKEVGIQEVYADLLPENKAAVIKELLTRHKIVGMVGDGVNDAPALALSSVGISIGSLGSDTALEAASIVILKDRLDLIANLVQLGRRMSRIVQANIFFAIAIKFLFVALALLGRSNLALAIFADVGVTLLVILNSLRLTKD